MIFNFTRGENKSTLSRKSWLSVSQSSYLTVFSPYLLSLSRSMATGSRPAGFATGANLDRAGFCIVAKICEAVAGLERPWPARMFWFDCVAADEGFCSSSFAFSWVGCAALTVAGPGEVQLLLSVDALSTGTWGAAMGKRYFLVFGEKRKLMPGDLSRNNTR